QGKGEGESLASAKLYQEANKEIGSEPGVFLYADLAGVVSTLEKELGKADREVAGGSKAVGAAVNFKAVPAAAHRVTPHNGTLRYRELALLNPGEKSPILEFPPSKPVKKELFHFTPRDTVLAAACSNDNGAERWARFVKLADHIAKASGGGEVPSEHFAKAE